MSAGVIEFYESEFGSCLVPFVGRKRVRMKKRQLKKVFLRELNYIWVKGRTPDELFGNRPCITSGFA